MNNVNINGSGSVGGGTYNSVTINGSGSVDGDIVCQRMTINGSGAVHGNLQAADHFNINGSGKVQGNVTKTGRVGLHGAAKIEGSVHCGNFFSGGSSHIGGDCEGEDVAVEGAIHVGGLVNGERVHIKLQGNCKIGSIGGTEIVVEQKNGGKNNTVVVKFLGFTIFKTNDGHMDNSKLETDTVEGDVITLVNTYANRVSGRIVKIGPGCRIGKLEYTESAEVDRENSTVAEEIQG